MKRLVIGILAHVDAGKTTLSEGLLYRCGALRRLGRVDHGDAFLDTDAQERARGITIFSKQALLEMPGLSVTLLDTPGHVDFSAEAERTLQVLDCAILVVSGSEGLQGHTLTLWKLLARYRVPVLLFVNKMDLPGPGRAALMEQLKARLAPGCTDFGQPEAARNEELALCGEDLMEEFLEAGSLSDEAIAAGVAARRVFPCFFGSALKLDGLDELLAALPRFVQAPAYGQHFSAAVYKVARDPKGERLTFLKITGGALEARALLSGQSDPAQGGEPWQEKVSQIRLYSGAKFTAAERAEAGQVCAVTGLTHTWPGEGLGLRPDAPAPMLEPAMTYQVLLDDGQDPHEALQKLRQLAEEDPQLHISWDEETRQIRLQLMGPVQLEVLRRLAADRFGLAVAFGPGAILYKETIAAPVEGVGHFEPLRHYAEVHLLLEPAPRGSGLTFATACPEDELDKNWQRLILTHLAEKQHRGVLIGAPITDLRITLMSGKAHLKHTEGGDFRQATYRAVRQGLMQARSVLQEPWYAFTVTAPTELIGRAITDIRAMGGQFVAPEARGGLSTLRGSVPAAEVRDYAETLSAYTQGRGRLQLSVQGYAPCHNAEAVIEAAGYDPEADLENTPDSVFCAHGAGFNVKWDRVKDYMHLESGLKEEKPPQIIQRGSIDDRELERIMEREFGPVRRPRYSAPRLRPATEEITIRPPKQRYIIVDGYNMIFAWDELAGQAKDDLDAARRMLCDRLSSYAGFTKTKLVVVFDGYKQQGNPGEKRQLGNIQVVYTPQGQTADRYIEELADEIGSSYAVRVASSDSLVQLSSFRSGVLRMSARELLGEVEQARRDMKKFY